jgi:FAD/FMN-containing dehydrogenase
VTTTQPTRPDQPSSAAPGASSLRGLCGGAVHLPGDPGYDSARMPWNVAVDQRPAAVAYPASAEEVAEVVRAAAAADLRVAAQGTGHNPGPLGSLADVVLVRTSAMTSVTVDPEARTARVGAGVLWLDVVEAVAPHGLMALHGSSPDVGVAGYSLGGGIGWYARELGLQTNSLTAVELVTPDGTILRADADTEPDLFWALRGGGGNFGVVTALEFRLYPIETAYAGWLVWDSSRARDVITRWATWAVDAPDAVTTSIRILNIPPIEEMPEPFRGRSIVVVDGAVLGTDEEAAAILAPLRELGPEMDTFERAPAASLVRLHMDPEGPTPAVSGSLVLGSLPEDAIDAMLAVAGPGSGSTLLLSELRQLGGALGRPHEGAGALPMLEGQFAYFGAAIAATPEMGAAGHADAMRVVAALQPWANGRQYLNFAENPTDASTGYAPEVYARLQSLRATYDPDRLMVANHQVRTEPLDLPAQR